MALELKIEEVELYSNQKATEPNEYAQLLEDLAGKQNPKASFSFENNPHFKSFKYAASRLKEKGLNFTFRKDKDKKETHTRVWWLKEAPVRKPREAKPKEETNKNEDNQEGASA